MRDKLIELLRAEDQSWEYLLCKENIEILADYLLKNDVFIPPFKVGTRVFVIESRTSNDKNLYIIEDTITHYRVCDGFTVMCLEEHRSIPRWNWDNVYASREEAEKALKGVSND